MVLHKLLHVFLLEGACCLAQVLAEQLPSFVQVIAKLEEFWLISVEDLRQVDSSSLQLLESLLLLDELQNLVGRRPFQRQLLPHPVELLTCAVGQHVPRPDLLLRIGRHPLALRLCDHRLLVRLEAFDYFLEVLVRDLSGEKSLLEDILVLLFLTRKGSRASQLLAAAAILVLSDERGFG